MQKHFYKEEQRNGVFGNLCYEVRAAIADALNADPNDVDVIWSLYQGGTRSSILVDVEIYTYDEKNVATVFDWLTNRIVSAKSAAAVLKGSSFRVTVKGSFVFPKSGTYLL